MFLHSPSHVGQGSWKITAHVAETDGCAGHGPGAFRHSVAFTSLPLAGGGGRSFVSRLARMWRYGSSSHQQAGFVFS